MNNTYSKKMIAPFLLKDLVLNSAGLEPSRGRLLEPDA